MGLPDHTFVPHHLMQFHPHTRDVETKAVLERKMI